jgi:probable phosphoglycerate mutase
MGRYKATRPTNERVALFAHAGFGIAFLSCVLDIPYTILGAHLSLRTTGVTAISFNEGADGYAVPVVQTFNSEAHLLLDNLPVNM